MKKKKSINKIWEKYLDKLWGLIIHNRDKGCQLCKKQDGKMDAHHIFSRRAKSTRWNPENGIKLCYYCHNYRILQDPESLRMVVVEKIGLKNYQGLHKDFHIPVKYINYTMLFDDLKHELQSMKIEVPKKPKSCQNG